MVNVSGKIRILTSEHYRQSPTVLPTVHYNRLQHLQLVNFLHFQVSNIYHSLQVYVEL